LRFGAAHTDQSKHLMPVFGTVLAVQFLGKRFHLYYTIGVVLIAAWIALASLRPWADVGGP
jgi:drug/metabolite transporter (DMT)-like permease